MNALNYALTARTVVLSNENAHENTSLLDFTIQDLHPTGPVQMDLITDIGLWNRDRKEASQRRLYNVETTLFQQQTDHQKEEIEAAYESYPESVEHSFAFRTLSDRLESRLERAYSRALNTLPRLRHLRESNLNPGNKYSAKRTESQERTPIANLSPQTRHAKRPTPLPGIGTTCYAEVSGSILFSGEIE